MYSTNYHRASSVADAVKMLKDAEDGQFIAGGQTLIPTMKARLAAPSDLIDLRHIADIKGIEVSGRKVTIGAGTTHGEIAASKEIEKVCPALTHLARHLGDPQVRHMGTMGGSIANNDPAADYPGALVALGATIRTDQREMAAEEFFSGLFETALEEGEIITAISFDAPAKAGYEKFRNPASRYALTAVFVAQGDDGVRVAVNGAGDDGVFRSKKVEEALSKSFDPSALDGIEVPSNDLMSDIHASAEYRANLIVVMARRAVAAANA